LDGAKFVVLTGAFVSMRFFFSYDEMVYRTLGRDSENELDYFLLKVGDSF
jgi:hypothetical protein